MTTTDNRTGAHTTPDGRNQGSKWWMWLLAALAVIALVVIGFFALGGDVDTDQQGELDVNVETPETDVDVAPPDIDAEAPDVDVDPGSIDVDDAEAEAEVTN